MKLLVKIFALFLCSAPLSHSSVIWDTGIKFIDDKFEEDIVRYFNVNEIDSTMRTSQGVPLFHVLVKEGYLEAASALLNNSADGCNDINRIVTDEKETALFYVMKYGRNDENLEVKITWLLKHGAHTYCGNKYGVTPTRLLAYGFYPFKIHQLLMQDCDELFAQKSAGVTLHAAILHGHTKYLAQLNDQICKLDICELKDSPITVIYLNVIDIVNFYKRLTTTIQKKIVVL